MTRYALPIPAIGSLDSRDSSDRLRWGRRRFFRVFVSRCFVKTKTKRKIAIMKKKDEEEIISPVKLN